MQRSKIRVAAAVVLSLSMAGASTLAPLLEACAQPAPVSYSQDIKPIIQGWCISCHAPGGQGFQASGLDLSTYEGLMKGTKFGAMVVPGQPDVSNLVVLIEGKASPQLRMPHNQKPLPSCLRDEVWSWVFQGAKNN